MMPKAIFIDTRLLHHSYACNLKWDSKERKDIAMSLGFSDLK